MGRRQAVEFDRGQLALFAGEAGGGFEGLLLVELKTVKELGDVHRMQCINYLKATGLALCLLLDFGKPRLEIKRVVRGL